ncbi:hypothetical protein NCLIV_007850 [Neospora caninum Liverpool]|uniref:Mannose-P-dolichol utilization defect 1 protein homolog n=1 Tax=Neospora caninum (strain Liverpool) TaxID=572307 RepID=F0V986_NEOCL|nr:hypothetical protein NCLIV_007850 [Neospora caninum Liverpool]CBZ50311.1 hypothetical protein NCLIV_007850 [Neospora caninum Liverpool]|eukprot:XP_003880345.1 hypothetical protein NCLIV_007850 [Neospora caninum Liverpool]
MANPSVPVSSPPTRGGFLLVDPRCTDTLFAPLQDAQCGKQVLSACLSIGVLVGGSLVKLPQLIKILRAQSVEGLAEMSVFVEAISSSIFVSYNVLEGHPFATWGEMLFVFFCSRLPQIKQNWTQKHTGQLSAVTGVLMLCGNLARLFTSLVSLSDQFVVLSCSLATILNAIPLFQSGGQLAVSGGGSAPRMFLYRENTAKVLGRGSLQGAASPGSKRKAA